MDNSIYEPTEDSLLLAKHIKKYSKNCYNCLDVGTGTGILAQEASKYCKKVLAIDINDKALLYCNKSIKNKNILFKKSDLFAKIDDKFDLVLFNPPYLPDDPQVKDISVDGGKHGYELIERFVSKVNDCLTTNGVVLLLFSSLTNKEIVNKIITQNLFDYKLIDEEKLFYERLFVYEIKKNKFLKQLDKKKIINIKSLARGKRGLIFTGISNKWNKNKKVAIKIQRKDKAANNTINNEIKKLDILNRYKIGPRLIDFGKDFFIYSYVNGFFIREFIEKTNNKKEVLRIIKELFNQMFILDKLRLNKEEMHHPYKHIIINKKNKPILIDFERCKKTKKPKNVTQFCQFLISSRLTDTLKNKGIIINKYAITQLAKKYKRGLDKDNLLKIIKMIR